MNETGILKKDMIINFTTGCYSDRTTSVPYVVLKDFNYLDEAKKFWKIEAERLYKEDPSMEFSYEYTDESSLSYGFYDYLIKNGFIDTTDSENIYIGGYSFFDADDWFMEFKKEKLNEGNN